MLCEQEQDISSNVKDLLHNFDCKTVSLQQSRIATTSLRLHPANLYCRDWGSSQYRRTVGIDRNGWHLTRGKEGDFHVSHQVFENICWKLGSMTLGLRSGSNAQVDSSCNQDCVRKHVSSLIHRCIIHMHKQCSTLMISVLFTRMHSRCHY